MLIGAGGTLVLQPGELEYAFVCDTTGTLNGTIGIFPGGISSSGLTAYPSEGTTSGAKRCTGGAWIPCEQYAQTNGFSCVEYIEQLPPQAEEELIRRERLCFNQSTGNGTCIDVACYAVAP